MLVNQIINKSQLFFIIFTNGNKVLMLAQNEDEIAKQLDIKEIAFCSSLSELESITSQMNDFMSLNVEEGEDLSILVSKTSI